MSRQTGKSVTLDAIVRQGFVPIFVNDSLDSRRLVEAAATAGCRVVEYSCGRPDAREMIPWIKREFPEMIVMAATLMDGPRIERFLSQNRPGFLTVDEAADSGVDALVSFLRFRSETYEKHGSRFVMIPGVGTPNEAFDQIELGADLIKSTVHTAGGSDFVTKMNVPTHHSIPFFVSGGLTLANLESYIQAGVVATAAGFDLLLSPPGSGSSNDLPSIAGEAIVRMKAAVQAAREKHQPALAAAIGEGCENLVSTGAWYHSSPVAAVQS